MSAKVARGSDDKVQKRTNLHLFFFSVLFHLAVAASSYTGVFTIEVFLKLGESLLGPLDGF